MRDGADRHPSPDDPADRRAAEALLTDGAAAVLALERLRLDARRRRTRGQLEPREAARLRAKEQQLAERVDELRYGMAALRQRLSGLTAD